MSDNHVRPAVSALDHAPTAPAMPPEIAALHAKVDMLGQAFNQLGAAIQEMLSTRIVCHVCWMEYVETQRRNETLRARGEDELPLPPLHTAGLIVNGTAGCLNHTIVGVPGQTPAGIFLPGR